MNDSPTQSKRITFARIVSGIAIALFLVVLLLPNDTSVETRDAGGRLLLSGSAQRLAACTLLMAGLWLSQSLPVGVTALLPLALYPLLGIQGAKEVSKSYISHAVFLFLGGFVIALGVERWGLHRRIALGVVSAVGSSPRRIVLGFMLATAFLSMWISNTASTLMMLPIGLALLDSLAAATAETGEGDPDGRRAIALDRLAVAMLLGTAYAASIGGFSTVVGTPTNVQFKSIWEEKLFPTSLEETAEETTREDREVYPDAPRISAGPWMLAILPMGLAMLAATWFLLAWWLPEIPQSDRLSRAFFRDRLRELGPMSRPERRMAVIFGVTAILWITRTPLAFGEWQLLPGWAGLLSTALPSAWGVKAKMFSDSTVAIGVMILMFAVPSGAQVAAPEPTDEARAVPRSGVLMDWPTAVRLPWEILLLFGGGLAIAGAFGTTQLSEWLGDLVAAQLAGAPAWVVVLACCLLMTFLTEVTSNVATVSALLPVLAPAAMALELDPRLVCIPAVVSASCAFMLPIATPPNAIVFGSGRVRMQDMVRYGIVLNLVGAAIITLFTFFFLVPMFGIDLNELPAWTTPVSVSPPTAAP